MWGPVMGADRTIRYTTLQLGRKVGKLIFDYNLQLLNSSDSPQPSSLDLKALAILGLTSASHLLTCHQQVGRLFQTVEASLITMCLDGQLCCLRLLPEGSNGTAIGGGPHGTELAHSYRIIYLQ